MKNEALTPSFERYSKWKQKIKKKNWSMNTRKIRLHEMGWVLLFWCEKQMLLIKIVNTYYASQKVRRATALFMLRLEWNKHSIKWRTRCKCDTGYQRLLLLVLLLNKKYVSLFRHYNESLFLFARVYHP